MTNSAQLFPYMCPYAKTAGQLVWGSNDNSLGCVGLGSVTCSEECFVHA